MRQNIIIIIYLNGHNPKQKIHFSNILKAVFVMLEFTPRRYVSSM